MIFLLDTNICIYIIKRQPQQVLDRFNTLQPSDVAVSAITVAELEYGAAKSQRPEKNSSALQQFLISLEIIPFDKNSVKIYGNIRANLEKQGQIIGSLDLLIAAQAISHNLILVTNNIKEFSRIPEIKLENWTA